MQTLELRPQQPITADRALSQARIRETQFDQDYRLWKVGALALNTQDFARAEVRLAEEEQRRCRERQAAEAIAGQQLAAQATVELLITV